jgi:hypothetical protein
MTSKVQVEQPPAALWRLPQEEETAMNMNRSVAEILARLEAQIAVHRKQEALHAQQEAFHRDQRAHHAAELETLTQRCETFKAAAEAVAEIADRAAAAAAAFELDESELGPRPKCARLAAKVVQSFGENERFGRSKVTQEINRRFGRALRRPFDERQVSLVLRRMARDGRIHLVRRGRPHWEALYSRRRPDPAA